MKAPQLVAEGGGGEGTEEPYQHYVTADVVVAVAIAKTYVVYAGAGVDVVRTLKNVGCTMIRLEEEVTEGSF